jgi:hypothetical protein
MDMRTVRAARRPTFILSILTKWPLAMYIDVELHLMSQEDVLVVTTETIMQLVRVDLESLLSKHT